jgi:hypothetical protein
MSADMNSVNKDLQEEMQKKENERGEINLGGREFTGNSTDIETSSTGLPTMKAEPAKDERDNKNSETAEKS